MSIELHGPVWAWLLVLFIGLPVGSFIGGYVSAALRDLVRWLRSRREAA